MVASASVTRPVTLVMTAIGVPITFRDFDDDWAPFLGSQGPVAPDGPIRLMARAWAARGTAVPVS
ncbi:MAG: hypothetical protein IT340_12760 [Chloroflexi bacterium]|nr:hypothetical protein [Chloroflexota bacterium]